MGIRETFSFILFKQCHNTPSSKKSEIIIYHCKNYTKSKINSQ